MFLTLWLVTKIIDSRQSSKELTYFEGDDLFTPLYRKKLKKMAVDYKNGKFEFSEINNSIQSWIGHVKHADSYQLRKELFRNTVFTKTLS